MANGSVRNGQLNQQRVFWLTPRYWPSRTGFNDTPCCQGRDSPLILAWHSCRFQLTALLTNASELGITRNDHVAAIVADVSFKWGLTHGPEMHSINTVGTTDNGCVRIRDTLAG